MEINKLILWPNGDLIAELFLIVRFFLQNSAQPEGIECSASGGMSGGL